MTDQIRRRVLWIGTKSISFDVTEFDHRRLNLEIHDGVNVRNDLATTRGIILRYNPEKPGIFKGHIEEIARIAIDHGVMIYAIADDAESQQRIEEILNQTQFKDSVYRRTNPPSYEIAERMARHKPGPPLNSGLEVRYEAKNLDGTDKNLDETELCFFKRAFWDCSSIQVKPLDGGRSANTFSVHAVFKDSLVGPRPLPFFVKIDNIEKIRDELRCYGLYVYHFIPFNLRPNIDSSRCISGHKQGMIVGNFVERSEPLWDVLRRGNADTVIYSLFDNALRGWRMQATSNTQNLLNCIGKGFDPSQIPDERVMLARKNGATKLPHELYDLLAKLPPQKHLKGPIHGDLHAANVVVRGNDSILIDFELTRIGPLVADPASLEVRLAFDITNKDDDDDEGWRKLMDILYSIEHLKQPPPPAREPRPREWLWNSIRQIRLLALSEVVSDYEYGVVVAIYLLRLSKFPHESDSDDFRKAYAYVLAENIIVEIAKKLDVHNS